MGERLKAPLTPHIGEAPESDSAAAVIHLMRLSNAVAKTGLHRLTSGLLQLARQLNSQLAEVDRVLVARDPRCSTPFAGATPDELEAGAYIAIGKYIETPELAAIYKSRRGGYLMLERYFVWCRTMFELLSAKEAELRGKPEPLDDTNPLDDDRYKTGALIGHWIAALCPVIEGWEELKLSDAEIDSLLLEGAHKKHRERLVRFRNGVFHYQRSHDDSRFTQYWDEASATGLWTIKVERAFERFFRIHAESKYGGLTEWFAR